jgi:hypothetical protein
VLPRAHRSRVSDERGPPGDDTADDVGDDSVLCPIAAADHVASSSRRHGDSFTQERLTISLRDEFRARFAGAVRIATAERVRFTIAPAPLVIFVALVGRDDQSDPHRRRMAHGVQQVNGAEHVARERLDGLGVGAAHQRLRREVKNDLGARFFDGRGERASIAYVSENRAHAICDVRVLEQVRFAIRRQRETRDRSFQVLEPRAQPAAFEAGVARDEDALSSPKCALFWLHQVFHGARPPSHCFSSNR